MAHAGDRIHMSGLEEALEIMGPKASDSVLPTYPREKDLVS